MTTSSQCTVAVHPHSRCVWSCPLHVGATLPHVHDLVVQVLFCMRKSHFLHFPPVFWVISWCAFMWQVINHSINLKRKYTAYMQHYSLTHPLLVTWPTVMFILFPLLEVLTIFSLSMLKTMATNNNIRIVPTPGGKVEQTIVKVAKG